MAKRQSAFRTWFSGKHKAPAQPARELTSLRTLYIKRLEKDYPGFLTELAAEPTIAGWSHNPWQQRTAPDAVATRIAERYIALFTKDIMARGYLPYIGSEINFATASYDEDPQIQFNKVVHDLYGQMDAMVHKRIHQRKMAGESQPDQNPITPSPRVLAKLARDDKWNGRVYVDPLHEMEIATPCQSPLANLSRVNHVKRVIYEGTIDYARHYAASSEGKQDIHSAPPCGPIANMLSDGMGQYNIKYANERMPTAEHLSTSLVCRRPGTMDYATAKLDRKAFAQANLMGHPNWASLFSSAFQYFLPNDQLLAYGHPLRLKQLNSPQNGEAGKKHAVLWHPGPSTRCVPPQPAGVEATVPHDEKAHLEIRSYNDASSNLALTTLAVIAIEHAILKVIDENPQLVKHRPKGMPVPSAEDTQNIMIALSKKYTSNYQVPKSTSGAIDRFDRNSTVLRIMADLVMDTVSNPEEREAMLEEIRSFKTAVMARPALIDRSYQYYSM